MNEPKSRNHYSVDVGPSPTVEDIGTFISSFVTPNKGVDQFYSFKEYNKSSEDLIKSNPTVFNPELLKS